MVYICVHIVSYIVCKAISLKEKLPGKIALSLYTSKSQVYAMHRETFFF